MTNEEVKQVQDEALNAIRVEREYQNKRWGTEFDDNNTINDWVTYITRYAGQAAFAEVGQSQVTQLVKVAALAVAALEAYARNDGFPSRHYDQVQTTGE